MPRTLPTDNADERQWIQFRGPQTSVVHDQTGVRFSTEIRNGIKSHKPLPVVADGVDPSTVPDDAVIRSVAASLVESNPLIAFGVACETCGEVFASPKSVSSHMAVHAAADAAGGSDGTDGS